MTEVDTDAASKQTTFEETTRGMDDIDVKIGLDDFNQIDDLQKDLDQVHFSDQSPQVKSEQDEDQEDKQQEEIFTRDLIDINRSNVNFNKSTLFPGSIEEIDLSISLKEFFAADESSSGPFFLKIVATCHNSEFNDLDQYVYSVRSNQRYEYYDEVHFRIKKNDKAEFKVAVKIPACKENTTIDGTLSIQLENAVPIFLPIVSKCEIPSITCLKILQDPSNIQLIKIPAKKGTRLPPLPFKNLSNTSCYFELETITSQDMSERAYDISCPSTMVCAANSPFFVMLQLKLNSSYEGCIPKTDTIRKVLVLKVKNSSLYFSYPIEVYVYQSLHGSSVS